MFDALKIAATGMSVSRQMMDVIAENIANANTTNTLSGEPYKRKDVIISSKPINDPEEEGILTVSFSEELENQLSTAQVVGIKQDNTGFRKVYDPNNPNADKDGYVTLPNVNVVEEMAKMIQASRMYEANLSVVESIKSMATKALDSLHQQ
ncbi:MAG: flagellar basal body rod protein FlgC [Candidatus Calescibacterium sp.]|nr:flagellar basal body rod protein FlgC [Candidatus Calescibacterium sp.]MCX7972276.1 flagellar basal body rod protein FlgC [bacterium]MDW8195121.1 flagellar basal body rod protein FlgC [Candidatus Calescibacterium sp.]